MNVEDINSRMRRVYLSIDQRYDNEIAKHLTINHETTPTGGTVTISFNGEDKIEAENQIFLIISHLAKLKDHLMKFVSQKDIQGM